MPVKKEKLLFEVEKVKITSFDKNVLGEFRKYVKNYLIESYQDFNEGGVKMLTKIIVDLNKLIDKIDKEREKEN